MENIHYIVTDLVTVIDVVSLTVSVLVEAV